MADPLDAAKVTQKPPKVTKPVVPPPSPPPSPPDPPKPEGAVAKRYRVLKGKSVSVQGQITYLPEGHVLSLDAYSPQVMTRLLEQMKVGEHVEEIA